MLAAARVVSPHTSQPFTEEFILGLGGGIGGGYFVFQYGKSSTFFLGARGNWEQVKGEFSRTVLESLGASVSVKEAGGEKAADKNLHTALNVETPVMAWVDKAWQPYFALPESMRRYVYHQLVVVGFDETANRFKVDDLAPQPWLVDAETLSKSRASITSQKNRILTFTPGKKIDVAGAARAGIELCLTALGNSKGGNFGLEAFDKWASLIDNKRDKKGWPTAFPPGPNLYRALTSMHGAISAGKGGAFRPMFADFLEESAAILKLPSLKKVAADYRELSGLWNHLADSALPDAAPALAERKRLERERAGLIAEKGPTAEARIQAIGRRIAELERAAGAEMEHLREDAPFPLSMGESAALLEGLRAQIVNIARAERAAAAKLTDAIA